MNYLIVSSQTHIHSSLLCSAQKITEDGKFQRVMKKGINNACRTSKTPRLFLTLAGITNSDFQIYHGDESGPFQEFFENFKFRYNN